MSTAVRRGLAGGRGSKKPPLPRAAGGREFVLCSAGWPGALGVVGCAGHPSRGEAAMVGKGRGCVPLNRAS